MIGVAAQTLRERYLLLGKISSLVGEADRNFKIQTENASYILKIMRPDCQPEFVDKQIGALAHLARKNLGLNVQRVALSTTGASRVFVRDRDGAYRIAWLVSYLPGPLLADVMPIDPATAFSVGAGVAAVDAALSDFDHAGLNQPLKWNLAEAGWIADRADQIADPKQRTIVERINENYLTKLAPALNNWPHVAIHNDANDMNLVVSGARSPRLTGIIDFGDMTMAPRVCGLAIAGAYIMMGGGDPIKRLCALAAGYCRQTPLSDQELDNVLPLAQMRLAVSVTNAAIEKQSRPDDPYVTISEKPAWSLLEALSNIDTREAAALVKSAISRPADFFTDENKKLAARRRSVTVSNQKLSYDRPLNIVRGDRHYLYDASGHEYIDAYNNVPHVGHARAEVIEAVADQMARVNTNTRYLQDIHIDYAERLTMRAPPSLTKAIIANSASEANEIALRLARAVTGRRDMIVMDHAYHGCTTGAIDISPYKFNRPGMNGPPDWVTVIAQPDPYRDDNQGDRLAGETDIDRAIADIKEKGRSPAGFICECLPSVGGQIVLPPGFLKDIYEKIRAAGGVVIADDVQTGLGRLGHFFWGFEQQDATPDIVVLGKPLGNGYPLAAVLMTDDIANAFARGPEFFSTFGGSSAACAAGIAVLEVMERDNLQANAKSVGDEMIAAIRRLADCYEIIGDVRGFGFFIGVELVKDRKLKTPATEAAQFIKNSMRENGVLIGTEGPHDNVLKIRPPMTFDKRAAEQLVAVLDSAMAAQRP